MNLLILLAGVADPKWPLPATLDTASLAAHRTAHPLLSPFDEAALELALKWRDADPATQLRALVGGTAAQPALLRHVAGYRLDLVEGLDLDAHPAWDAATLAQRLAAWVAALDPLPDLVLMGREFGDDDDGVLPALLAETLQRPFIGQALGLTRTDTGWQVLRQHGAGLERLSASGPAVIAVTNHTGNRLRHPLLKNVMAAKRLSFSTAALPASAASTAAPEAWPLRLAGVAPTAVPRRDTACRMLDGTVDAQAAQLARLLLDGVAA